ncbi:MAG: hypothetical protein U9P90_02010 [Patescibacteria group bacterium]|nr:hypothetical protein [Patescibacteria group bacterium]
MKNLYVEIIPALRLPKQFISFDYILPDEFKNNIRAGSIVFVPFSKKTTAGIVLKIKENTKIKNIKPIKDIINNFVLPEDIIKIIFWMKDNLDISLPLAAKTVLPDIPKKL